MLVNKDIQRNVFRFIVLSLAVLLFVAGCTHRISFTIPAIPIQSLVKSEKGTAVIGLIEDKRPAGTVIFLFSNPPHKWIYQTDGKPEQIVRDLIKEGLKRRGIVEKSNADGAFVVKAEIVDFSGHNTRGAFYVGNCFFNIICNITIVGPGGDKTFKVAGAANNKIGRLSEENIDLLLQKAYADFLKNLDLELEKAGV